MAFFITLTSIPSTKVVFIKSNRLAKRVKKNGGKKQKETNRIKDAVKISVKKTDVTGALVFNVLNEHPWVPKTFCAENLAIVDNNHPIKLI
jgi:hypothetical protein